MQGFDKSEGYLTLPHDSISKILPLHNFRRRAGPLCARQFRGGRSFRFGDSDRGPEGQTRCRVSCHIEITPREPDWHGKFCDCSMRVLIADDQKSVGITLAELVRLCQHEVVEVVGSGLEAIHAYDRHRPDVVLMDYQMPKFNGATACRNIVAKYPTARVILVSGSPQEIADSGALAVLLKPIRLDQLYAALYDASPPSALGEKNSTP